MVTPQPYVKMPLPHFHFVILRGHFTPSLSHLAFLRQLTLYRLFA